LAAVRLAADWLKVAGDELFLLTFYFLILGDVALLSEVLMFMWIRRDMRC